MVCSNSAAFLANLISSFIGGFPSVSGFGFRCYLNPIAGAPEGTRIEICRPFGGGRCGGVLRLGGRFFAPSILASNLALAQRFLAFIRLSRFLSSVPLPA